MEDRKIPLHVMQRLHLIDFLLDHFGTINRSHLMDFYGLSMPQVSMDFQMYQTLAPGNMVYSPALRRYERGLGFKRAFP